MATKMASEVVAFLILLLIFVAGCNDFCLTDSFKAECEEGHVILMTSALFGRMNVGRCITRNYGNIGCYSDVLPLLDLKCSGQMSCEVSVSDPAIVRTKPCPPDFASYLKANFTCIKVIIPFNFATSPQNPPMKLELSSGYIGGPSFWGTVSDVPSEPGVVQTLWCSYRLQWLPNFRYRITLVDLGLSSSEAASKSGRRYPNGDDDDDDDEDADDEEGDDGLWLDATGEKTLIDGDDDYADGETPWSDDGICQHGVVVGEPRRSGMQYSEFDGTSGADGQSIHHFDHRQQHLQNHQQQQQQQQQTDNNNNNNNVHSMEASVFNLRRSFYASLCERNVRYYYHHHHHHPENNHYHHHRPADGRHGNLDDFRPSTPFPHRHHTHLLHHHRNQHQQQQYLHHHHHHHPHHHQHHHYHRHQSKNLLKAAWNRTELLYISESHQVDVTIVTQVKSSRRVKRSPNVLIHFEAFGCPEPTWLPTDTTWVLSSDAVSVTCNQSGITYVIKCLTNGSWESSFNNCSDKSVTPANSSMKEGLGQASQRYLALSLLITFGIAAIGVLYVGAMVLCAVYIKRQRNKRRSRSSCDLNIDQMTSFLDQRHPENQCYSPTILPTRADPLYLSGNLPVIRPHHHYHTQHSHEAEVSYLMKQEVPTFPRSCFVSHHNYHPSVHPTISSSASSSSSSKKAESFCQYLCKVSSQQQSLPLLRLSPSIYPHGECPLCAEQVSQQQQEEGLSMTTTTTTNNNLCESNQGSEVICPCVVSSRGGGATLRQQGSTGEMGSRTSSLSLLAAKQPKQKPKYQPIAGNEQATAGNLQTDDSSRPVRPTSRSYPSSYLTNLCEKCSDPSHWLATKAPFQLADKSSDVTSNLFCDRSIQENLQGNDPDVVKLESKGQKLLNSPASSNHQRHLIATDESQGDDAGSRRDVISDIISNSGSVQV